MAKKTSEADDKAIRRKTMEDKRKTTHNFYYVTYSKGRLNIEIDLLKLTRKLKELGFYRYDYRMEVVARQSILRTIRFRWWIK